VGEGPPSTQYPRDAEVDQKKAQATKPVTAPPAIEQIATQIQKFPGDDKSPPGPTGNHGFPHKLRLSPVAAVIAVLIIATRWIPYDLRPTSPVVASSSPQRSNAARQESLFAPVERPVSLMAQAEHLEEQSLRCRAPRSGGCRSGRMKSITLLKM